MRACAECNKAGAGREGVANQPAAKLLAHRAEADPADGDGGDDRPRAAHAEGPGLEVLGVQEPDQDRRTWHTQTRVNPSAAWCNLLQRDVGTTRQQLPYMDTD